MDIGAKTERYFQTKDIKERRDILLSLVFELSPDLKEFFFKSFKKERYLDMKLLAVRGYAYYATEKEVEPLMKKMLELLKKRQKSTPYNYQEYEPMRSPYLMPYLLRKYEYDCFVEFNKQLEKQYNEMPDAFKGIFTFDEKGDLLSLMSPQESSKRLTEFFEQNR